MNIFMSGISAVFLLTILSSGFVLQGRAQHLQPRIYHVNCSDLLPGQYFCLSPEINHATQQPKGCTVNNTANSKVDKNHYLILEETYH